MKKNPSLRRAFDIATARCGEGSCCAATAFDISIERGGETFLRVDPLFFAAIHFFVGRSRSRLLGAQWSTDWI